MEHKKKCCKCENVKLLKYFHKNKAKVDGHASMCRECYHKYYLNEVKSSHNARVYHLKKKYNITVDKFNEMKISQDNKCAVCDEPLINIIHIDHDHASGKIRGLLCNFCNQGLGLFKDNPDLLRDAARYLEVHIGA